MPDSYFFFRPLLAADKHWAALDWSCYGPDPTEASDLAGCFIDARAADLARLMPLVVSTEPGWLGDSEFIEKFEANQAIFVVPAAAMGDGETIELCAGLRKKGRHLALRLDRAELVKAVPRAAFDHLQVDATFARYHLSPADWSAARCARSPLALVPWTPSSGWRPGTSTSVMAAL